MRGFMEVILGEGLDHTKLSPRDDGQVCRRLPKIMLKSAINFKDTLQSLAVCSMEFGHSRAIPKGCWEPEVASHRN